MNQVQEWYYKGDADITYGEVHVSNAPKIILALVTVSIFILLGACFILRNHIYDLINNPRVILISQVRHDDGNYVTVPYKYELIPENYIDTEFFAGKYELLGIENDVNTNQIGKYEVRYMSKNLITTNEEDLIVSVQDITSPSIKLKANLNNAGEYDPIILVRSDKSVYQTLSIDEFNPEDFILEVTDDYSDPSKIEIDWTRNINFGVEGTTSTSVIYTATDEAQNIKQVSLPLVIMDSYDAVAAANEERITEMNNELINLQKNGSTTKKSTKDIMKETDKQINQEPIEPIEETPQDDGKIQVDNSKSKKQKTENIQEDTTSTNTSQEQPVQINEPSQPNNAVQAQSDEMVTMNPSDSGGGSSEPVDTSDDDGHFE